MYATIMTVALSAGGVEQARTNIQKNATGMRNAPGFQHAEWVYDHTNAQVMVVVVFDREAQATAAWERMGPTVTQDIEAGGGRIVSRTGGEVLHHI
jgi:heme-degrading monooxygenase HmoA